MQGNFHGYRCLRMPDMPVMEVHSVPATNASSGVGARGLPTLAPSWQMRCFH